MADAMGRSIRNLIISCHMRLGHGVPMPLDDINWILDNLEFSDLRIPERLQYLREARPGDWTFGTVGMLMRSFHNQAVNGEDE